MMSNTGHVDIDPEIDTSYGHGSEPAPSESLISTGAKLKKFRTEKGLSLEIVHEATKIPMDALRAIEEGYTVRTLSPFYYRGFIKIYANYLELDITGIVDDYKPETVVKVAKENIPEFDPIAKFRSILTRKRKQQIVIAIGILLVLFLVFKILGFLFSKISTEESSKNKATIAHAVKSKVEKKTVAIQSVTNLSTKPRSEKVSVKNSVLESKVVSRSSVTTPASLPVVVAQSPKVIPSPPVVVKVVKDVSLTVRATKKTWLRVKSDGQVVFQSNLQSGGVETWEANDSIEISGKNIHLLEFELNGKLIGQLGRKDRKAREIVVSKDGLRIIK